MKILVVDDEEFLLEIWAELFRSLDWEVATASGGHAAVTLLKRELFDMVITDVRMPAGDSFVVLDYLQGQQEGQHQLLAFVCSGYIDDEATMLDPYQIERIIRKPFSFAEELGFFKAY